MSTISTEKKPGKIETILQSVERFLNKITPPQESFKEWKSWEKILFRFFFIFLLLLILPIDWKIFREIFSINWLKLHLHDLFRLSKYQVEFIAKEHLPEWGIGAFANWGIAFVIAIIGTLIWTKRDKDRKEYTVLYYWLRVLVRYRLAFVLITYGFIKLFPLQMPYPSLSNLHTNYGDYFAWKVYFQTVGIAPKYESFLGFVEILAAFLLFFRRTVTFGVGLIFGFIGNVAVVNGWYDIGEIVTSTFIVFLAAFLFANDIPRLYHLLIKELPTKANKLIPNFSDPAIRKFRRFSRYGFLLFVALFTYKSYDSFAHDPYKIPKTPGLKDAYGYYNVKQFILNHDTLPYSKTDPNRWQDVIFERWSTLTIKVNRPVKIDFSSGEIAAEKDIDRNYELAGFGGRHYFYYDADTINHTLALQNKNINHRSEKLSLTYERPDDSTIILYGLNENNDSIHVVLEKIDKKYMMYEGRRKPVKL
jgi:hypothetical protein